MADLQPVYAAALEMLEIWFPPVPKRKDAKTSVRAVARDYGECDLQKHIGEHCVEIDTYYWEDGKLVHTYSVKDD